MRTPPKLLALSALLSALALPALSAAHAFGPVTVRPATEGNLRVVGCDRDGVGSWLLDASGLRSEWHVSLDCSGAGARVRADGTVLVAGQLSSGSSVAMALAPSGEVLWRAPLEGPAWGAPLEVAVANAAVVRLSEGTVRWLSLADGSTTQRRRVDAVADPRSRLGPGGAVLVAAPGGPRVLLWDARGAHAFTAVDAQPAAEFEGPSGLPSAEPTAADLDGDGAEELLVPVGATVWALSRSGSPLWQARTPTALTVRTAPVLFDDASHSLCAAFADGDGWVSVLRARDGAGLAAWPRRAQGSLDAALRIADADGDGAQDLLLTRRDGSFEAFALATGAAREVPAAAALRAPLSGSPAVGVLGSGVVQWVGVDGDGHLVARPLASTALGPEDAVLVGDDSQRAPRRALAPSVLASGPSATATLPANPATSSPAPASPSTPRGMSCSSTPGEASGSSLLWCLGLGIGALFPRRRAR